MSIWYLVFLLHCRSRGGLVKSVKKIKIVPQRKLCMDPNSYTFKRVAVGEARTRVCWGAWRWSPVDSSEPQSRLSGVSLGMTMNPEAGEEPFPLVLSADHLLSSFTAAHCLGSSSQEQFIGKAVSCEGRVLCIVVRPLQLRHPCLLPQARESRHTGALALLEQKSEVESLSHFKALWPVAHRKLWERVF